MMTTPDFLDGNAAAGVLAEVFGAEVTAAAGSCVSCGGGAVLAEMRAYVDGPGVVLRCPGCDAVLLRVVRSPQHTWVEMTGLRYLQIPREA